MLKSLPAMQASLGQEDDLEKEMATHSSILTWRIPWTEEPGRLQSMGWQRVGHNLATHHPPHQVASRIKRVNRHQMLTRVKLLLVYLLFLMMMNNLIVMVNEI